ncbi:MAG TPA: hypothetical protein VG435_09070 [Acidimicrobiales bacterium]|jgi:hypothetical protein|nr:hypothetical protein [Acidimicrobiales bacterium]
MAVPLPDIPIHAEDPDDEWQTAVNTGHAFRIRYLTAGLLTLAILGGGFWGGVVAEKHHGTGSSSAASLLSRFAAARGTATGAGTLRGTGATGGTGAGGAGGAAGGVTAGTVIDVSGTTLEISDTSGNIVKVTVPSTATVTRTSKSALSGLQIGDTVIVSGATGAGGSVTATAVRASAQGVSAGGGGFAGGGGAGGFTGRGTGG